MRKFITLFCLIGILITPFSIQSQSIRERLDNIEDLLIQQEFDRELDRSMRYVTRELDKQMQQNEKILELQRQTDNLTILKYSFQSTYTIPKDTYTLPKATISERNYFEFLNNDKLKYVFYIFVLILVAFCVFIFTNKQSKINVAQFIQSKSSFEGRDTLVGFLTLSGLLALVLIVLKFANSM